MSKHSFKNSLQLWLNLAVQFGALLFIVGLVNYLAFTYYQRWDHSKNQRFVLADQTRQVFKSLKKPLKIIVFFAPGSPLLGDVDGLIKECQYLGRKNVEFETVDPYRNFTRARELQAKYKFGSQENVVILDYDGRTAFVNASDMADYDNSGAAYGQEPRLVAFKGEQALVGALISLTEQRQSKLLLLAGHGEPTLGSPALATFKTYIERQNATLETVNLMDVDALPADAQALIIAGPKYDFSERELLALKAWWERKGRIFLMLEPSAVTPRLLAFLKELGVVANDDRVLATVSLGPNLAGIVKEAGGEFVPGSGPITRRLKGVNTNFLGLTQSLTLQAGATESKNIRHQPLIQALKGFWGETEYIVPKDGGVFFDPKKDHGPPLILAASIEKGGVEDSRVQVDSSRMVVVGNGEFLNSDALTQANLDFALCSLNWLLDREELIGIAPKVSKTFVLNLTQNQISSLAFLTMGAIPLAALLVGLLAWFKRRR